MALANGFINVLPTPYQLGLAVFELLPVPALSVPGVPVPLLSSASSAAINGAFITGRAPCESAWAAVAVRQSSRAVK
jgi:hypothetical protein